MTLTYGPASRVVIRDGLTGRVIYDSDQDDESTGASVDDLIDDIDAILDAYRTSP